MNTLQQMSHGNMQYDTYNPKANVIVNMGNVGIYATSIGVCIQHVILPRFTVRRRMEPWKTQTQQYCIPTATRRSPFEWERHLSLLPVSQACHR
jgi:hypothetical protein